MIHFRSKPRIHGFRSLIFISPVLVSGIGLLIDWELYLCGGAGVEVDEEDIVHGERAYN